MSHDELRALVPAYATGELAGPQADALRAHLAAGCAECLEDIFRRPVGLPRTVPREVTAPSSRRGVPAAALLTALGAVLLALVTVCAVTDLQRRQAAMREDSDRRALLADDERAALEARVRRLEGEVEGARAEASAHAEAARAMRAENARLQAALGATEAARPVPTTLPPRPVARTARNTLRPSSPPLPQAPPALAAPQRGRLQAVPPFQDPHGHVLWNPGRSELQLYANDLPPLPEGAIYRLRLRLDDGRVQIGPALQPGADGTVSRVVTVVPEGARVREVEIVLEPSARTVLAAHLEENR